MFRSRFNAAFPKSLPNFGPQDIERGVVDTLPDESVEKLLCALIGLVLNRKKDVEFVPHASRALRERCDNTLQEVLKMLMYLLLLDEDITSELWKRLFKHTTTNGPHPGTGRIFFTAAETSII